MKDWRKTLFEGTVAILAVMTACNTWLNAYVARNVANAKDDAAISQHLAILDLTVASVKGWQEAHDARTQPLIAEHQEMARQWPRAMALLEDMHWFLVRKFQMPSSVPEKPKDIPGLYAAEPPGAKDAP